MGEPITGRAGLELGVDGEQGLNPALVKVDWGEG